MEWIIFGRNAVLEAMTAQRMIDKILVMGKADNSTGALIKIIGKAKALGIPVVQVEKSRLDSLSEGGVHQGVVAYAAAYEYANLETILERAKRLGEPPFIVICDKITDPHNLGAIIRTANAAGVHGVIISKHESAGLSATVAKAAAGALEHMLVHKATNIVNCIEKLKKEGVWIAGAAGDGEQELYSTKLEGALAVVIGSEGGGLGRLVRKHCDFCVRIPMKNNQQSLNASVAAALILYQRMAEG